jgi:glycerol uptake facilitator protein
MAHAVLPIAGKAGSDWSYAWIPSLGPIVGAILAAGFVKWTGIS